jgi:hypothetical protein
MTRGEVEEIFVSVVLSGESAAVKMTAGETNVFRVIVGRVLKEMEKKNRPLWLKARDYGIERKGDYTIIKKLDIDRYPIYRFGEDGKLYPFVAGAEEEMSKIDSTEKGEDDANIDTNRS